MGGVLNSIGSALGKYATNQFQNSRLGQGISAIQRYRQAQKDAATGIGDPPDTDPSNIMDRSPVPQDTTDANNTPSSVPQQQMQDSSGAIPMANGATLVTRPTIVLLGEKGPESVQPLNSNPMNKTSMPAPARYRGNQ
jgi:hypothetical protein